MSAGRRQFVVYVVHFVPAAWFALLVTTSMLEQRADAWWQERAAIATIMPGIFLGYAYGMARLWLQKEIDR